MPKAYFIASVNVHDLDAYQQYRAHAKDVVEAHGGRYLVRGGEVMRLEGEVELPRLVVIEFPSTSAARSFYESDAYQSLSVHRHKSAHTLMWIAEGLDA